MEKTMKQLFKTIAIEKTGQELEKIIEEIILSTIYDLNEFLLLPNIMKV